MENWQCDRCTFSNPHSTENCQMCHFSRHEKVTPKPVSEPPKEPDNWQCERCTFQNSLDAARCHLCGVPARRKIQSKRNGNDTKVNNEDSSRKRRRKLSSSESTENKKEKGASKCTTKSCDNKAQDGNKCAYHGKLVNFREQIRYAKKHLNKSVVATLIQKRDKFRSKGNRADGDSPEDE